jgi:hypothetical protein
LGPQSIFEAELEALLLAAGEGSFASLGGAGTVTITVTNTSSSCCLHLLSSAGSLVASTSFQLLVVSLPLSSFACRLIVTLLLHLHCPICCCCHLTIILLLSLPLTANKRWPHVATSHLPPNPVLITIKVAIALAVTIIIPIVVVIAVTI